jgi:uncharacterized protein (DUF342 family)
MKYMIYYFDVTVGRIFVEKTDENGEKYLTLSSPYNFVSRDEIIARPVNAESKEEAAVQVDKGYSFYTIETYKSTKPGDGVYFDQFAGCLRAMEYGFVIYDQTKERIRLLPPLQVSRDKIVANYIIFPTKFSKIPDYADIEKLLQRNNILAIQGKEDIDRKLAEIDPAKPRIHRIEVARGKEAVNGYDEYFIPIINIEKKAGKMLHDGRMDFKEVGSIIEVVKEQEILKKNPAEKPVNGFTIYGETIEAVMEKRDGYLKGDNIVQSLHDETIYLSGIDGCVNVENKKVSVLPYAIIKGNVDYESGNIDFNGSVLIKGSIMPGFSVKAKGNIIVEKNVDDAHVEATGDIQVKAGITGKGATKVIAGGKLKTLYILNSNVEAVDEIEVEDSIINCKVFSNDRISVTDKHGKIMGSDVTARHEIIVNAAGSPQENTTVLTVGKSLFVEREMAEIRKEMNIVREKVDETIRKIKASFGEDLFKNPKDFVAKLPTVKKKNCLILLKDLSESNRELKELTNRYKETEEKNKLEREPTITITDVVYPGTVINIQKRRRLIEQKIQNAKFFEDQEEKVVKFTSAV